MPWVSPLKELKHERGQWTPESLRVGVIAKKIGVHPMWDVKGRRFLATLLQVVDNHVLKYIPPDLVSKNYGERFREGTGILMVGAQSADPQIFTKEYCNLFQEAGLMPKVRIHRFIITPDAYLQPGTPLYANHFQAGQFVDVIGKT
jgi:large subunit ribosomal protein L3